MNWPIQSAGADLMRVVCIAATEVEIEVACPVHDAFLIVSPLDRLDQDVEHMREILARASEVVTGGLRIRVDAKIVRAGRYMDERGSAMWDRVMVRTVYFSSASERSSPPGSIPMGPLRIRASKPATSSSMWAARQSAMHTTCAPR